MSLGYEVARLLLRLGVAAGLALAIAAIVALLGGRAFGNALEVCCYIVGALMLVLAASGNSPGRTHGVDVESGGAGSSVWRAVIGDPANPPTATMAPAVPFLFAGVVLIGLGLALAYVG